MNLLQMLACSHLENVNFIATDEDKKVYGYKFHPDIDSAGWSSLQKNQFTYLGESELDIDWKESLLDLSLLNESNA